MTSTEYKIFDIMSKDFKEKAIEYIDMLHKTGDTLEYFRNLHFIMNKRSQKITIDRPYVNLKNKERIKSATTNIEVRSAVVNSLEVYNHILHKQDKIREYENNLKQVMNNIDEWIKEN